MNVDIMKQIEYIAPYLPYSLTAYRKGSTPLRVTLLNYTTLFEHEERKPVLRPLSDLKNNDLFSFDFDSELIFFIIEIEQEIQSWFDTKILLSNHYDIFGLIEKKLAIDINTIQ